MAFDRLTKGERFVLERLVAGKDLVESKPGGWWSDDERVDGRIGWSLLRKCYITSLDYSDEEMIYYKITEDGEHALTQKVYVPKMYRMMQTEFTKD